MRDLQTRRALCLALILVSLGLHFHCDDQPEVVVRIATRIFRDGGIERAAELRGRTTDLAQPQQAGWFDDEAGITLAAPEAWSEVAEAPDHIRVSGAFARAEDVPPLLALGGRVQRVGLDLRLEDAALLRRWSVAEQFLNPQDPLEVEDAFDALVDAIATALRDDLRRELGDDVDVSVVDTTIRRDLLPLYRALQGAEDPSQEPAILNAHDVPVELHGSEPEKLLFEMMQRRLFDRLPADVRPGSYGDLDFVPVDDESGEAWYTRHEPTVGPVFEAYLERLEGPRYTRNLRFEISFELPGQLLRTSGAPDANGLVHWLIRREDFGSTLSAVSVELDREAMTALGADLDMDDTATLVRLEDLLFRRDPSGTLREHLAAAIDARDLDTLLGVEGSDDARHALELYELLGGEAPAEDH